MPKLLHYIILVSCFITLPFFSHAQEDTVVSYFEADTVVEAPVVVKDTESDEPVFDSVSGADKLRVQTRPVDRKAVEKMRSEDDFWYYNTAPEEKKKIEKKLPKKAEPDAKWLPYLLWIIVVGGFIAFLVWFLATSNVQLFKRASKAVPGNKEDVEEKNIFEINYDNEIADALKSKNFRLAIRLMYLRLLMHMSEKGIIDYKQTRTNNDYVMQLYGTTYYKDFSKLTRHFEYTWYGQFPLSEEGFASMRNDFDTFKNYIQA